MHIVSYLGRLPWGKLQSTLVDILNAWYILLICFKILHTYTTPQKKASHKENYLRAASIGSSIDYQTEVAHIVVCQGLWDQPTILLIPLLVVFQLSTLNIS